MTGLNTCTLCRAMRARRSRRMSSSVLPLNMEPVITSMEPQVCFISKFSNNKGQMRPVRRGASALVDCCGPGPAGSPFLLGRCGFRLGCLSQKAARAQPLLKIDQALAAETFQAQQSLVAAGQL